MKLLFIHELFPPYTVGGGEIYCENLVKALIKKGIDVRVVAGGWTKSRFEEYDDIPIYRVNLSPTRYSFNITAFFALIKVVREFKPDIIHANTVNSCIPASILSKFYRIPLVISVHSLFLEDFFKYYNPIISSIFYFVEEFIFKFPYDRIIALDRWVYHNLCRLGLKRKTTIIPHPINTKKFKPKRKKHKKIIVGTVINLSDPTKRADFLFNLIKKIKEEYDVDFLIIGQYIYAQKEMFEKIGIKLIGRVPYSILQNYFNKIDIFIGHGMAAKEAIACGCFTILNESTLRLRLYHKDEIDAGLMKIGDPFEIVKEAFENPSMIKSQIKKSVKFINEKYSTDKVILKTIRCYHRLLAS